jgi:prepilin-type processing-associated H-X9-DG protein
MGQIDYLTGDDPGDNENLYVGMDNDLYRTTYYPPARDTEGTPPNAKRFGATHPSGINMLFCDGTVRFIGYNINANEFLLGGQIK